MELVLPKSFYQFEQNEMLYLDGGATQVTTGSARYLQTVAGYKMGVWASLAIYGTVNAGLTAAAGIGIGFGIGAAYCTYASNEYRSAYNYFSGLVYRNDWRTNRKMYVHTFLGLITGIGYE